MADQQTTFRLRFENDDMKRVFEELLDQIEKQESALDDLGKTQREYFDKAARSGKEATKAQQEQVRELDKTKVSFENLRDVADETFDEISEGAGQSASLLRALGKTLGPIGIALTALGAAVAAAFLDVRENAKAARRELAALQAQGNELRKRTFAGLRGVIKSAFGDATGAALEFGRAINGVNGTLSQVAENARNVFDAVEIAAQVTRNLNREEAERANNVARLLALSADETRSTEERINLIRQAAREEVELNDLRQSRALQEIALLKVQNQEWQFQPEILDQINDLETELIELQGANQLVRIQSQQEINALLAAEAEARERILQAVRDFSAVFNDREAERALEKQVDLLRELRDSILESGLGDQFGQELEDLDFTIAALGRRIEDGLIEPLDELPTKFEEIAKAGVGGVDLLAAATNESVNVLTRVIGKVEKLSEEQKQFIINQGLDVLTSVGDLLTSATEQAIQRQSDLISARQNTIRELERQLSEEEALQEQGLANNTDRLRRQLAAEGQLLRQEEEKRIQLRRKQARQQLAIDALQQASQTTLAVANLLAQGASGFLPGLIIATSAIALLFRIFSQSKAQAAALARPPQFRQGTDFLVGPSHERGGVLIEAEGGERIFSREDNAAIGGPALSNEDAVRLIQIGQEIEDIRAGAPSIDDAIKPIRRSIKAARDAKRAAASARDIERDNSQARAIQDAIREQTAEIIEFWKTRPVDTPMDENLIREYFKGGVKVREVIRKR